MGPLPVWLRGWEEAFQIDLRNLRMRVVRGSCCCGEGEGEGAGVWWSVEVLLAAEVEIQDFSAGWLGGGGEEEVALPCSSSGSGSFCCL